VDHRDQAAIQKLLRDLCRQKLSHGELSDFNVDECVISQYARPHLIKNYGEAILQLFS